MQFLTASLLALGAFSSVSQAAPSGFVEPSAQLIARATNPQGAAVSDVAGKEFTYVIIGGGTAGLTIAARLSEDPKVTVAVLEAGGTHFDDESVDMPAKMGYPLGNSSYDWGYHTVPQVNSLNLTYNWSRGKGTGGSSAINFMIANRGHKDEYDAWERLGNSGWNFKTMLKYFKKSETFQPPSNKTFARIWNETYDASSHGHSGPLSTSFTPWLNKSLSGFFASGDAMGLVPLVKDPYNGEPLGQYNSLDFNQVQGGRRVRSYSAVAYWQPNAHRKNLHVVTNATVSKILFADQKDKTDGAVATGVLLADGESIINAANSVILSAGAIVSPQILELSGIGNTTLLNKYNISTVVDLPGVGENLQDRPYSVQSFEMSDKPWVTAENVLNNATFADEEATRWRNKETSWYSFAPTWVAYIPYSNFANNLTALVKAQKEKLKKSPRWPAVLGKQYEEQFKWLDNVNSSAAGVPAVELLFYPGIFPHMTDGDIKKGRNYMTIMSELQHPFFRGSIHINSTDVIQQPQIDPHYFEYDFDTELIIDMAIATHKLAHTGPLAKMLTRDNNPTSSTKTRAQWLEFSKKYFFSSAHAVGTCALGVRKDGGVLDPRLKVWGTKNLRVADASIFPLQVSSHPSMTVYAIAEHAADMIKEDYAH